MQKIKARLLIPSTLLAATLILSGLLGGCGKGEDQGDSLVSIQFIDRNGTNETISHKERINQYKNANFLETQPYQKISRFYKRDKAGKSLAKLTSYHENGMPWQYLETVQGRAHGVYKEWYANGNLRMVANVIEGVGDLSYEAQSTWIFDDKSQVWGETGQLMAEITYGKGLLTDKSVYYYPNGAISKIVPYHLDKIEGVLELYAPDGDLLGTTQYVEGVKEGLSTFKGSQKIPPREEEYVAGLLMKGKYWGFSHQILDEIKEGNGVRPIYEEGILKIKHEYRAGLPEGLVQLFRADASLECIYHIIKGQKEGPEWCYYPAQETDVLKPMLLIPWRGDEIHGIVRTWYKNGVVESEKEMAYNKKQGLSSSWYEDGSLMLVEEYDQDLIVSGKYFRRGDESPISRIQGGQGVATLFDKEGSLIRKIEYSKGLPAE